jgi:hypothetical protein
MRPKSVGRDDFRSENGCGTSGEAGGAGVDLGGPNGTASVSRRCRGHGPMGSAPGDPRYGQVLYDNLDETVIPGVLLAA